MPKGAKYKPKTDDELKTLLEEGVECRDIDFSEIYTFFTFFSENEELLLQDNVYFIDPKNPDLLIWNTEKAHDMSFMFYGCGNFNKPVRLDTRNAENMNFMFKGCKSFDQFVEFNVQKCNSFIETFHGCESLNKPVILRNIGKDAERNVVFKKRSYGANLYQKSL